MQIKSAPDIHEKLSILSKDSQYDLACACGTGKEDRRYRAEDNRWLYPVTLPDGGKSVIFKSLVSNVCTNDCAYCPLRQERDPERCSLTPDEIVRAFLPYYNKGTVFGLFLSSGVTGSADNSMERMIAAARILRYRERFKGYIHLKIIPGASQGAIEEALKLSSAVSLNIEVPNEASFTPLSKKKDFKRDIIEPIKFISRMTAKGAPYSRVRKTTQFIVGASTEKDADIIKCSGALYDRMDLDRVYFSAYQRGLGNKLLPGETSTLNNSELLMREHRLYQSDFLLRQYRFNPAEIPVNSAGQLSLEIDPKEAWARHHPECFPININKADYYELLRVPGIGPTAAKKILAIRKKGAKVRKIEQVLRLKDVCKLSKIEQFVSC
ncbi:MAG: helix-hairpin-helix domain-containing protein [Fibrobacteres bacterium]|nr:helix-hairpin-helix domain-containing protein [Fibrobacterota bacterium]